jgi:AcrR family transcriptional regulator
MSTADILDASTQKAPRWRRKPQARPDEVLEAALDLFALNGFAATRMEDIAKAAGMSKAAIYLYFPSKSDVFKALVEQRVAAIDQHFHQALALKQGDPIEGLRALAKMWAISANDLRTAALPRIILAEAPRFPELADFYHKTVIDRTQGALIDLIVKGQQAGQFRAMEPILAARALVSPLIFEILRRQAFPSQGANLPLSEVIDVFFDPFINGIVASPLPSNAQNTSGVSL